MAALPMRYDPSSLSARAGRPDRPVDSRPIGQNSLESGDHRGTFEGVKGATIRFSGFTKIECKLMRNKHFARTNRYRINTDFAGRAVL